jgi:hypothetical protein
MRRLPLTWHIRRRVAELLDNGDYIRLLSFRRFSCSLWRHPGGDWFVVYFLGDCHIQCMILILCQNTTRTRCDNPSMLSVLSIRVPREASDHRLTGIVNLDPFCNPRLYATSISSATFSFRRCMSVSESKPIVIPACSSARIWRRSAIA